ncbi:MAG: molybdate ABC transporter permease subunit [Pirellulales bacterium]
MTAGEISAILLSLRVAAASVVLSLPFGLAIGWLLARRSFRGRIVLETLVNLPLVLPPVVTGYLLLVLFGRQGWVGGFLERYWGLRIVFDWKGAAVAAAVVSFPLMVRAIRLAFRSVDSRYEQAARTLGAGPWDTFFTVTLPLARHGVIAGCVLAFARGLGEFGATVMIAGNIPDQTRTIPLYIYNQLETPGGLERSYGVLLVSIALAAAALVLGEWLERRGGQDLL